MNVKDMLISWSIKEGINKTENILKWVDEKNKSLKVNINKVSLDSIKGWSVDNGIIKNANGSFFTIVGMKKYDGDKVYAEQPIIIQDEIGYLGFICKKIEGVLHFLVQAKIEPGNINKIQLSPTIQATKSNFEQKHGGKRPAYLDYFLNAEKYEIIVDQIQSEQAERFNKKRNRNIIIDIKDDDIEVLPSHMWMTLGQIKALMRVDNLVNMDTRTVLSCIPYSLYKDNEDNSSLFNDKYLYNSIFNNDDFETVKAFRKINNYKMFDSHKVELCRLDELNDWHMLNNEFVSKKDNNFKVVFCDLEIEGREVRSWGQPLFEATGIALFVLFATKFENKYKFLVKLMPESGSFDKVELGPTIQNESVEIAHMPSNEIEALYVKYIKENKNVLHKVMLSEEGGRFYHEQNTNIVIVIDGKDIPQLPEGYMWLDYKTLNLLQQTNNVLNIQLRNLLSLLEV